MAFEVGQKVKVYNPYGAYTYESVITEITKGGKARVNGILYKPTSKDGYAVAKPTRWGQGSISAV